MLSDFPVPGVLVCATDAGDQYHSDVINIGPIVDDHTMYELDVHGATAQFWVCGIVLQRDCSAR
jgi:hypothetical protein